MNSNSPNESFSFSNKQYSHVNNILGDFGPWQKTIFFFFFLGSVYSAWHALSLSFYAPNVDYWCTRPENFKNESISDWIKQVHNNTSLKCYQFNSSFVKCNSWEYDTTFYKNTIIDEWNIVCDRAWLASMTQSLYMAGAMVAVIVFGQASDIFGRLPLIWIGLFIELLAGLSCAFSISIEHFMISRFFLALGGAGRWSTGFILLLEITGPQYRSKVGIGIDFGWALGYISLPCLAYLLRDFRPIQVVVTFSELVLLIWWVWIPESFRWQLTHNQYDKAQKCIFKAARQNNQHIDDIKICIQSLMSKCQKDKFESKKEKQATLFDLWKKPNLRKRTLILYFSWFVNSFVYYGLSLNTNNLGGDPFINFFLAGAVEFPAYALSFYVLDKFGRKNSLIFFTFGGGISCIATKFFYLNDSFVEIEIAFALIGKFCVTCTYATIYVYSTELYPTVVRNVGVGSSSLFARIGSILAPFVKELDNAIHIGFSLTIFGFLSMLNSFLIFLLPETKNREIPDTINQAENFDLITNFNIAT